ncbi:type 1 glutamine amidotransferase [Coraliomargarita sinensis]|nr:type 1 glutamine amidotransferase [Coraliomargarita sinensis]
MHIICFQHVPFEGPAAIADWADSRGHALECIRLFDNEPTPPCDSYDMLLIMGGPMNIDEETEHPWLTAEKAAIREAIQAGKIVVGICLGAQLIADALGAKVERGPQAEIGWLPIEKSPEASQALRLPDSLRVFHWHGDSFTLPVGAVRIASSAACPHQGFLYQERVLALQCHLESTPASMHALIDACEDEIGIGPYIQDASTMRSEPETTFRNMQAVLFQLLDRISCHG